MELFTERTLKNENPNQKYRRAGSGDPAVWPYSSKLRLNTKGDWPRLYLMFHWKERKKIHFHSTWGWIEREVDKVENKTPTLVADLDFGDVSDHYRVCVDSVDKSSMTQVAANRMYHNWLDSVMHVYQLNWLCLFHVVYLPTLNLISHKRRIVV